MLRDRQTNRQTDRYIILLPLDATGVITDMAARSAVNCLLTNLLTVTEYSLPEVHMVMLYTTFGY